MKELYLDSANIDEIRQMIHTDAIAGVTTNPTLMAKEEKGDYISKLEEIASVLSYASSRKHLSVEVLTTEPQNIITEALDIWGHLKYNKLELFVKVPVTLENLSVISKLADNGVNVNATACMTTLQAKMAHDAGAKIVSFFYNRMKDYSNGKMMFCPEAEIKDFCNKLNRNCKVICGSIRKDVDVLDCWNFGADIVTVPMKILREMVTHPKTDEAIAQFKKDIDTWLS